MQTYVILVALSFLFGVIGIHILRRFDVHEQEPFGKMVLTTLFGGVAAVLLSLALYKMQMLDHFFGAHNAVSALLVIGPIEEFGKFFALFLSYPIFKKEMNEPIDGILYMSCVALGFSLIENYMYAMPEAKHNLVFIRVLVATPAHLMFSAFMGLAFFEYKFNKVSPMALVVAWLFSSFLHGIYDLVLMEELGIIVLVGVFIFLRKQLLTLLSYTGARSPYRQSLAEFIQTAIPYTNRYSLLCLECGDTEPKKEYIFGKIHLQRCSYCGRYVTTLPSLLRMFRFFGSHIVKLKRDSHATAAGKRRTIIDANIYNPNDQTAGFDLYDLHNLFEQMNEKTIKKFEKSWLFRVARLQKRLKFELD